MPFEDSPILKPTFIYDSCSEPEAAAVDARRPRSVTGMVSCVGHKNSAVLRRVGIEHLPCYRCQEGGMLLLSSEKGSNIGQWMQRNDSSHRGQMSFRCFRSQTGKRSQTHAKTIALPPVDSGGSSR